MSDLLITHGIVLTVDPKDTILEDGAVFSSGGRIVEVGPSDEVAPRHPLVETIDAGGMVVMPGLVNSHTHLSMTMLRSIADDIEATAWLPVIWAIEAHLKPETVYAGALLGIAEMIASGTTCFNDHYFMMDQVARAAVETGVRAQLAEAILENRDAKKGRRELENGARFASEWNGKADGRIVTRIGPHALYTCSTPLIVQARQAADRLGVGMHMHVAESKFEMKLVGRKDKAGETSVQHLDGLGVLKSDFVLAHGLTIDEKDMAILAGHGVGIAHCPQAYAKVGGWPFPPVDKWIKAGISVGLGTDGVASNNNLDLFDEMRFASLVRKLFARDGTVLPARQVIRMATIDGAKVLRAEREIGSLEAGKRADLILVDLRKPHLTPRHNLPGHLVYSAAGADVDTVIVDGRVLMRGRRFLTLDLPEVLQRGQAEFEALLGRAGWTPGAEEPTAGLAATLRLKVVQQSLKVMQVLTGQRAPAAEDEL
jgi:5-methylthioadenosine/S-adenosylhomocysteine deaminase